jgi:hypothetical protein
MPDNTSRLARVLWPLPPKVHDWMFRHLGRRPARIVHEAQFDARGRRHVTSAQYMWDRRAFYR